MQRNCLECNECYSFEGVGTYCQEPECKNNCEYCVCGHPEDDHYDLDRDGLPE